MKDVIFTWTGFWRGVRTAVPLSLGMVPFGLVVGVMAQAKGLSLFEALLMSGTVFAGASQIFALEVWTHPVPIFGAALAVFIVNLRMALMGPALGPWLDNMRGLRVWGTLALVTDHAFALSVTEIRKGYRDAAYLTGISVVLWFIWVALTGVGHVMGGVAQFPPGHPLFFGAPAAFITLLVPMWRGRTDAMPWLVAALVAIGTSQVISGNWYVVTGAISGALVGALRVRN